MASMGPKETYHSHRGKFTVTLQSMVGLLGSRVGQIGGPPNGHVDHPISLQLG